MRIEQLTVPFEVKGTDASKRQFEGYSATWDLDLGSDIIHKGAFARTIEHFRRGTKQIPLIDSHRYGSIFDAYGTLLEAEETDQGVWSKWQVIDGTDGERVMDRLRSGVVRKKSIGYQPVRTERGVVQRDGKDVHVRHLHELKWEETSLVLFPMNPYADVDLASVKTLSDALRNGTLTEEQEAEIRALPDEAKTRFRALLSESDPPDEGTPAGKGLAPDDPQRIAVEERLRAITLRSLAV